MVVFSGQMTVENCMYQEGACGSNNVHIKIPNRKIFKNQNVHVTTREHGASGKSTRSNQTIFNCSHTRLKIVHVVQNVPY